LAIEKVQLFLVNTLAVAQGSTIEEVELVVAKKKIQIQAPLEILHLET